MSTFELFNEENSRKCWEAVHSVAVSITTEMLEMLIERIALTLYCRDKKYVKSKEGVEMTINELVKKARKDSGMSMQDVAQESGVPAATICRYEKKGRKVSVSYLRYWIIKGLKFNWEELEIDD